MKIEPVRILTWQIKKNMDELKFLSCLIPHAVNIDGVTAVPQAHPWSPESQRVRGEESVI